MSIRSNEPEDPVWPPLAIVITLVVVILILFYSLVWAPSYDQANKAREKQPTVSVKVSAPGAKEASAIKSTLTNIDKEEAYKKLLVELIAKLQAKETRVSELADQYEKAAADSEQARTKQEKADITARMKAIRSELEQLAKDTMKKTAESAQPFNVNADIGNVEPEPNSNHLRPIR